MKKAFLFFIVLMLACSAAFAEILVLYSGATGTTAQVTSSAAYAPRIVEREGCDIQSSPTVTVTVLFRGGNAYRDIATFDGTGLASATVCTTGACNVQFAKTLRAMDALITAATSTAVVQVNCSVR